MALCSSLTVRASLAHQDNEDQLVVLGRRYVGIVLKIVGSTYCHLLQPREILVYKEIQAHEEYKDAK